MPNGSGENECRWLFGQDTAMHGDRNEESHEPIRPGTKINKYISTRLSRFFFTVSNSTSLSVFSLLVSLLLLLLLLTNRDNSSSNLCSSIRIYLFVPSLTSKNPYDFAKSSCVNSAGRWLTGWLAVYRKQTSKIAIQIESPNSNDTQNALFFASARMC